MSIAPVAQPQARNRAFQGLEAPGADHQSFRDRGFLACIAVSDRDCPTILPGEVLR